MLETDRANLSYECLKTVDAKMAFWRCCRYAKVRIALLNLDKEVERLDARLPPLVFERAA